MQNRPVSQVVRLPPDQLPGKGDIVAIDAEFVSLMVGFNIVLGVNVCLLLFLCPRLSLASISMNEKRVAMRRDQFRRLSETRNAPKERRGTWTY